MKRIEFRLFLLAVVVRLLFVALFPGINYYNGITNEYFNVASNLIGGHGFTSHIDIAPWNSGYSRFIYEPFVARPAGYVLFAALVFLFTGVQPVAVQILQAIVTGFSAVLVYKLALEIFEDKPFVKKIAVAAGVLAAVWPNQARFEIALLPDGLTTLVMLGFALELTRYVKTRARRPLIRAAIILGLSIFLRPDLVLFPAMFLVAGYFILTKRELVISTLVLVAALAITIGINTFKNYELSGETVPLNLGSGTTMYEGISQFGDTLGTTYADERLAHNVFHTKELFYPNGVQNDRMAMRIAIDTIKHHPLFYATVVLRRIPLMFTVRGLYFSDSVNLSDPNSDLSKRFPGKYIAMFRDHPVQFILRFLSPALGWLLVIMGFWGVIAAFRIDPKRHFAVALILLYFILTHLATNVEPRYFYPAVPLLYAYAMFIWYRRKSSTILPETA